MGVKRELEFVGLRVSLLTVLKRNLGLFLLLLISVEKYVVLALESIALYNVRLLRHWS